MRNTWTMVNEDTGAVEIAITADTEARGIVIEKAPDWHSYQKVEAIVSTLNTANAWLLENGGVA